MAAFWSIRVLPGKRAPANRAAAVRGPLAAAPAARQRSRCRARQRRTRTGQWRVAVGSRAGARRHAARHGCAPRTLGRVATGRTRAPVTGRWPPRFCRGLHVLTVHDAVANARRPRASHRPCRAGGRRPGHGFARRLCRRDLRAWRPLETDPAAARAHGAAHCARPRPDRGRLGGGDHRLSAFTSSTPPFHAWVRRSQRWGSFRCRACCWTSACRRRRSTRRSGAFRGGPTAARYAHGHDAGRDGGAVAGVRIDR